MAMGLFGGSCDGSCFMGSSKGFLSRFMHVGYHGPEGSEELHK